MFEVAEKYDQTMGRWSRQLAPLFVEFAGVRDGDVVLDVGCGTGALSSTLARTTGAAKIVGIDPFEGFIAAARSQITDPRMTIDLGDAWKYDYPAYFDLVFPKLKVGGLIVADNITFPTPVGEGIETYIKKARSQFNARSQLIPLGSGLELKIRLG